MAAGQASGSSNTGFLLGGTHLCTTSVALQDSLLNALGPGGQEIHQTHKITLIGTGMRRDRGAPEMCPEWGWLSTRLFRGSRRGLGRGAGTIRQQFSQTWREK